MHTEFRSEYVKEWKQSEGVRWR